MPTDLILLEEITVGSGSLGPLLYRCLMYYYGDESEIDLDAHGEREFSEWCWMPLEDLPHEVRNDCSPVPICLCSHFIRGFLHQSCVNK
jgi:hypothetical protein